MVVAEVMGHGAHSMGPTQARVQEKETIKLQKSRERWLYKCGHLVCKGCLDRREHWLKDKGRKNACPTCNQDMPKSHCHAFGKVYLG